MVPLVANGTIGNQRTLNVSRQPMVPSVPMLPLVETLVPMVPLVIGSPNGTIGNPNGVNSNIRGVIQKYAENSRHFYIV